MISSEGDTGNGKCYLWELATRLRDQRCEEEMRLLPQCLPVIPQEAEREWGVKGKGRGKGEREGGEGRRGEEGEGQDRFRVSILLSNLGWLQTLSSPTSAFQELAVQACSNCLLWRQGLCM